MHMKKKKFFLLYVTISIIAAVVLVHVEFSHPGLKNIVTAKFSKILGMPVMADNFSIKLLQGVKVENLSLGDESAGIFTAKAITLKCNFFQLFRKRLDVHGIVLETPVLTLPQDQIAFLLLPLVVASDSPPTDDSEFQFQLEKTEVRNGKISIESETGDSMTLDEIDIEISSEGTGKPVNIKAGGKMEDTFDFSVLGSYNASDKTPVDVKIVTDIDWNRLGHMFPGLKLTQPPDVKEKTAVDVILKGNTNNLKIDISSNLTENELLYGNILHKPGGFPVKFEMSSVYSAGTLDLSAGTLEIGKNCLFLSGSLNPMGQTLTLNVRTDSLTIPELAEYIPKLKGVGLGGMGKLDFDIRKGSGQSFHSEGSVEVKDWMYGDYRGKSLTCDIESNGRQTKVDDIHAVIGEGKLTGSGLIEENGKYKFYIKGENIDMERFINIKKDNQVQFGMSGKAKLEAQITNKGGGVKGLNGLGNFRIQDGAIESFSWLEELFTTIHLPELMPFEYTNIAGNFSITDGKVDIKKAILEGENAVFTTEEGEIDLVGKTKDISADFAISPALAERERAKFREFDKFFYVDEAGSAHLSIVWKGSLAESTPDLAASLLKTGIKKYGTEVTEILETLFGKDKEE